MEKKYKVVLAIGAVTAIGIVTLIVCLTVLKDNEGKLPSKELLDLVMKTAGAK